MIPIRPTIVLVLAVTASHALAQQVGTPEPDVRTRVDAFVAVIRDGGPAQYEAMAQQHFAPPLLARVSAAERRTMAERIRRDFGAITVTGIRVIDGVATIGARGATGLTGSLVLALEPALPFRITSVAVEVGGGDDEHRPAVAIPLTAAMTADEMSRTLDASLQPLVGRDAFAGVVLIARDGVPIVQRTYGIADRERGVAVTADTRFGLASIGKLFTKAAIAQLIAAGKVRPTDTVGAILPDYPASPARQATVEQLLEHRGGIADFFGPAFAALPKDRFRTNTDYYRFVAAQPVRFAPGERNEYCNGCYIVLGAIIERVSGMPYETYLARHVFAPAGMTGAAASTLPVANGYTRRTVGGGPDVPLHSSQSMHGAGGSAAGGGLGTAADLLAFDNALRTGTLPDGSGPAAILPGRPVAGGRARGGIGAAGGAPGTNAALESDDTWTIVVLANLDPPAATSVAQGIRRALAK
ncbi:MAG: serine hydrolase domain-containing protein [Vicinamibacteraceae bacterium]